MFSASRIDREYVNGLELNLETSISLLERTIKSLTPYASKYMYGCGKYHKISLEIEAFLEKVREKRWNGWIGQDLLTVSGK